MNRGQGSNPSGHPPTEASGVEPLAASGPVGLGPSTENHEVPWAPRGYRLVPVEPTPDMIDAGLDGVIGPEHARICYRKMLNAAPIVGVERKTPGQGDVPSAWGPHPEGERGRKLAEAMRRAEKKLEELRETPDPNSVSTNTPSGDKRG